jgi:hypothetical protein
MAPTSAASRRASSRRGGRIHEPAGLDPKAESGSAHALAGLSRMYGGLHYRFDITAGQELGTQGGRVGDRAGRPLPQAVPARLRCTGVQLDARGGTTGRVNVDISAQLPRSRAECRPVPFPAEAGTTVSPPVHRTRTLGLRPPSGSARCCRMVNSRSYGRPCSSCWGGFSMVITAHRPMALFAPAASRPKAARRSIPVIPTLRRWGIARLGPGSGMPGVGGRLGGGAGLKASSRRVGLRPPHGARSRRD